MDLNKLHKIDEELTKDEVAALKFLCMNYLGRKRLETVKDAKDLFIRLSEQDLLKDNFFLSDLLYTIGRYDLLPTLGTNREHVKNLIKNQSSGVSLYRKMLYELSEDITDEKLHDVKFLLSKLPKAKMATATFLEVLAEMEKMEMLGEDNLDELESVLSICNKELAYKVQKFKNTEESISSSEPHEEVNSLPVQAQEEFTSLPNISVAETNRPFPPPRGSLSGSESMDTDSQGRPALNWDDCYPMTQRPLGHCLIINNYTFSKTPNLSDRRGTDEDKDALTEVFTRMHFQVEERRDLSSSDMLKSVQEFSDKDHSKMDAFVCCILTHGEKGSVLGIDGKPVLIRDLTKPFARCLALTGKPKIFFIQACQGKEPLKGVWRQDGIEDDEYEMDAERAVLSRVPIEADFLIGMATVESYQSFRHTKTGSIFIQELCKHLHTWCPKNEDILSILTKVNHSVSAKELNKHKQMPEPRYTLTKKLVLPID